jgi:nucleoside-diphosphate-sugar epimerase
MPRALVTGAGGFIGGNLVRALSAAGWEVNALVRSSPPPAPAIPYGVDGSQEQITSVFAAVRPDVVFHLASLFLVDHLPEQVEQLARSNIIFPMQIVDAMARTGCRNLVNTGTAWQFDEDGVEAPVNLYAATKQAFEAILPYYRDAHGLSTLSLRIFDTYGPGDTRRKLIKILLDAAVSGERLDMSRGAQTVDLTHVDDVAAAFVNAGDRLLGSAESLNETWFVSGERQDVRTLVSIVSQALNRPIDANFGGRPYRPREVMVPVDPQNKVLPGWVPRRSLIEALPMMISV